MKFLYDRGDLLPTIAFLVKPGLKSRSADNLTQDETLAAVECSAVIRFPLFPM